MAPLKVYGLNVSTCTMRVLTTLYEKEAGDFDFVTVNLKEGEHKGPAFLTKQPFGQIPVLEDGDVRVFESRAIARYVSNKFASQGTDLIGSTLEEKAAIDQWLEAEHSNYNPPISTIVFEKVFKSWFGGSEDEAVVAKETEKLTKVLDIYDSVLAKQPYLAGNNFTLADLSHLPYTHYLINVANYGDIVLSRPNVKAWWERISSRPSFKKVLEFAQK